MCVQFVLVIRDGNPSKIKPGLKLEGILQFSIVSNRRIFKRVLKLSSVKKQIFICSWIWNYSTIANWPKISIKASPKMLLYFSHSASSSFYSFQWSKFIGTAYIYPIPIKVLMPFFLSVYAELLEHLNDTLLFFRGQLWNPRMPFSVDVDFPLQQYNPTLSSDGHACLLPLVASHFHISAWTLYLMHKFSSLSYLHRKPKQLHN
jgi:hypothetical protein